MIAQVGIVLIALTCTGGLNAEQLHSNEFQPENGGATKMTTNIAVVGRGALDQMASETKQNLAIVDPTNVLDQVARGVAADDDIEEDPSDPFITNRKGKRRAQLMRDENEWAEEEPVAKLARVSREPAKVLSRKKRCGGGGGGDGDGDARRSRRARRARRTRRARARRAQRRAARKAAKTSTTTVTRKVIQNGQVVSQTTETQGAATQQQQPGQVVVQHQPATVQTIQHQPAPVVQTVQPAQPAQPVAVVQQQPAPAVAAAPAAAMPSISVNGAVKIN